MTGALLGGFVAVELIKRIVGYTKPTGDKFALIVPLGIIVGRLGCLTHGCCQGIPCELGPFSTHGPDGMANWPAVPVEILFNLVAFLHPFRALSSGGPETRGCVRASLAPGFVLWPLQGRAVGKSRTPNFHFPVLRALRVLRARFAGCTLS